MSVSEVSVRTDYFGDRWQGLRIFNEYRGKAREKNGIVDEAH